MQPGPAGALQSTPRTVLTTPVYEALKERIMDQTVSAGQRLNIDALAAELHVSQTPVREALARLAAERLVTFVPYKGYAVSPLPTEREVAELLYVRKLLELDAVRHASARIDLRALHTLMGLQQQMEAQQPQPQFRAYTQYNLLDQQFHELIVAAAENSVLLETYRSLHVHVLLARFFNERGEVDAAASNVEHRAIYDALVTHDAEAATLAMALHLDGAYLRALR